MRRYKRRKTRITVIKFPSVIKGIIVLFVICVLIRTGVKLGAEDAAQSTLSDFVQRSGVADSILGFELNLPAASPSDFQDVPGFTGDTSVPPSPESPSPSPENPEKAEMPRLFYNFGRDNISKSYSADAEEAAKELFGDGKELPGDGITLKNYTDYEIDIQSLLNEKPDIAISDSSPSVLIIHTHGSEAYKPDGQDLYVESDPSRTEDKAYNMVRVGDELMQVLEGYGISVLHDRELYDYPSYEGSYSRELTSVETWVSEYPSISVIIDLHRDAIEAEDGTPYRTYAEIDGVECSQILLVVGTDTSGLEHPNWHENMKLALRLQYAMNEMYPSLAKPISVSTNRYNQHAANGSLIVEVGCNGNTLQESLYSAKLFGNAAAAVLKSLSGS